MNSQTKIHCSHCGTTIQDALAKQPNHKCPQCGHIIEPIDYPSKAGHMSQRQLILMMVLLPLLVVAMTVASWYLIKAYRLPSAQVESQSNLMQSEPVTTLKNKNLSARLFF